MEVSKIRLTEEEIKAIKETAIDIFGDSVNVWIFGSRVNPDLKGGDIDIQDKIGEQRIDVIVKPVNCKESICIEIK